MQPRRLSILGVGLLGGSIGLAVRERVTSTVVTGYAHRSETLQAALSCGAIHEGFGDAESAVRDADLVILCTPVGLLPSVLKTIAPALAAGALVTDVGSTKRSVVAAARDALAGANATFVGSHPMAGSEKRGISNARGNLFDNAICIVTPDDSTPTEAVCEVEAFWRLLGMRTARMSAVEHDRRICDVSHLPHALAAALVSMQDPDSMKFAGKGFADMTRIADGGADLWRDIFMDNRDNLRRGVYRLQETLAQLIHCLEPGREAALCDWLAEAAEKRSQS